MVSRARFHALHCRCRTDLRFMKHSREYLLAAIDGLRSKEKWRGLTIRDFPIKEQSASTVKNKRFKLDMEEDSDGGDYDELLEQQGNEPIAIQSETEESDEADDNNRTEAAEGTDGTDGTDGTEVEEVEEVEDMGDD